MTILVSSCCGLLFSSHCASLFLFFSFLLAVVLSSSVLSFFTNIPVFGTFYLSQILYFLLSFSSFQSIFHFNSVFFLPFCLLSSILLLFLSIPPLQFPIILTGILKWVLSFLQRYIWGFHSSGYEAGSQGQCLVATAYKLTCAWMYTSSMYNFCYY